MIEDLLNSESEKEIMEEAEEEKQSEDNNV
jgi:hypothetical protein